MGRQISATSVSTSLVEYLRDRGQTLREIGEIVGLSESFISRVANGHRSFTVDHLEQFEQKLGQPLPALLLEATWRNRVPPNKQDEFNEVLVLLKDLGGLRTSLDQDAESNAAEPRRRNASAARRAAG